MSRTSRCVRSTRSWDIRCSRRTWSWRRRWPDLRGKQQQDEAGGQGRGRREHGHASTSGAVGEMAEPGTERDVAEPEDREDDPDVERRPPKARGHERRVARDPAAEADEQEEIPCQQDEDRPIPNAAARG